MALRDTNSFEGILVADEFNRVEDEFIAREFIVAPGDPTKRNYTGQFMTNPAPDPAPKQVAGTDMAGAEIEVDPDAKKIPGEDATPDPGEFQIAGFNGYVILLLAGALITILNLDKLK